MAASDQEVVPIEGSDALPYKMDQQVLGWTDRLAGRGPPQPGHTRPADGLSDALEAGCSPAPNKTIIRESGYRDQAVADRRIRRHHQRTKESPNLPDGTPIPTHKIRDLACDAEVLFPANLPTLKAAHLPTIAAKSRYARRRSLVPDSWDSAFSTALADLGRARRIASPAQELLQSPSWPATDAVIKSAFESHVGLPWFMSRLLVSKIARRTRSSISIRLGNTGQVVPGLAASLEGPLFLVLPDPCLVRTHLAAKSTFPTR